MTDPAARPMTGRRRFAEVMRYGTPDRVPYFEEGLRDEVLQRWYEQGLSRDTALSDLFPSDHWEWIDVDLRPRPEMDRRPTSAGAVKALAERLDPYDRGRLPEDWDAKVQAWRTRDHVLRVSVHRGYFLSMGVGDWNGFLDACYLLADNPKLAVEVLETYADFYARLAEWVLGQVDVDLVTFSEPIGGPSGSLISPQMYERLILPTYRPVMDAVRRAGITTVVFQTYANASVLLPAVLDFGFDCVWACEVYARTMDYVALRRRFGRRLKLIGGIDLDVLLESKEAIRRELERKVPPLLADGGYIPLADGRVRPNVPFENYCTYRRLLAEIAGR